MKQPVENKCSEKRLALTELTDIRVAYKLTSYGRMENMAILQGTKYEIENRNDIRNDSIHTDVYEHTWA